MPIEFPVEGESKKRIRADRVIIHYPVDENKASVSFRKEQVWMEDGKAVAASRLPTLKRYVKDVVTETVTATDPVTGQEITISAAGVAEAIEQFFYKWCLEDSDEF